MSAKRTLMFVHPSKELNDDDWRAWFNQLATQQP
jgi:hypothetical protein